ncbi:hypothetical protein Ndes2526B_g07431 [Nannochloris sp. 'desiccata']|nr:hypothetical protein KSW81_004568 [Chlorella desiccata (nom. nud.)]KAH7618485.1 putative Serine/threonine-protein kinase 19 [Chlorella desiccata (nom. nud.)]
MVSEGEGPARKRLKTYVENPAQILSGPIVDVNRQEPLAQINVGPILDDDDDDQAEIPNDTVAALNLLKIEFPKLTGVRPFATRSQLYTILNDKTLADREIDQLKHENKIRIFKLPSSLDDYAVILIEDYAASIAACKQEAEQKRNSAATTAALIVFDWFRDRVLPVCCDVTIMHDELVRLLSNGNISLITEAHVTLLLQACCLTRHTGQGIGAAGGQGCYLFSMPGAGAAVRGISAGRKEIINALKRKRHPEMLESQLVQKKLKGSPLGIWWHLRDLLGTAAIVKMETTVGPLIRVAKGRQLN